MSDVPPDITTELEEYARKVDLSYDPSRSDDDAPAAMLMRAVSEIRALREGWFDQARRNAREVVRLESRVETLLGILQRRSLVPPSSIGAAMSPIAHADPTLVQDGPPASPPVVKTLHTEAEEAELQLLYDRLKPEAVAAYINYFLSRTPAHLQDDMKDIIEADVATPPTPPPEALATSETPPDNSPFAPMPAPEDTPTYGSRL